MINAPRSALIISHTAGFLDRIAPHMLGYEGDGAVVFSEDNFQRIRTGA